MMMMNNIMREVKFDFSHNFLYNLYMIKNRGNLYIYGVK